MEAIGGPWLEVIQGKSGLDLNTVSITIDPGPKYGAIVNGKFVAGNYYLDNFNRIDYPGKRRHGKRTVEAIPGMVFEVDDGSYVGGSAFSFMVRGENAGKRIPQESVTPPQAATVIGDTVKFNTSPIEIKTGVYAHPYIVSTIYPLVTSSNMTVNCINGLTAGIDDRCEVGGSEFYFTLSSDGKTVSVVDANPAASGTNDTLTFNPVKVKVTPSNLLAKYQFSYDHESPTMITGTTSTYLLPSLVYWVALGDSDSLITPFQFTNTAGTSCNSGGVQFTFAVQSARK